MPLAAPMGCRTLGQWCHWPLCPPTEPSWPQKPRPLARHALALRPPSQSRPQLPRSLARQARPPNEWPNLQWSLAHQAVKLVPSKLMSLSETRMSQPGMHHPLPLACPTLATQRLSPVAGGKEPLPPLCAPLGDVAT